MRAAAPDGSHSAWQSREYPVLNEADPTLAAALAAHATLRACLPGTRLCVDEDGPGVLYLVAAGRLRLRRLSPDGEETTLALLGPGQLCHLARGAADTWLEALVMGTRVYRLHEDGLMPLIRAYPILAVSLVRQLDDAHDRVEDMAVRSVRERLARLLARLALADGRSVVDASHRDLAEMVGSTRAEVTKTLGRLRREGQVAGLARRRILVRRPRALLSGPGTGSAASVPIVREAHSSISTPH
jgi:CRP-like cAMP-binding protein